MLHKKQVVYMKEFEKPLQLEMCIRSMLYNYRYKNKKDFFVCDLETIKKAFTQCEKSINNMTQEGGGMSYIDCEISNMEKSIKKNEDELYKARIIIEDFRKKLKGDDIESNSSEDEKPKKIHKKTISKKYPDNGSDSEMPIKRKK